MGRFLSSSAFVTEKAWWQVRQVNGRRRISRIGRPPTTSHSSEAARLVNGSHSFASGQVRPILADASTVQEANRSVLTARRGCPMDEHLSEPDVLSQLAFIVVVSFVGFFMGATALQVATLPI